MKQNLKTLARVMMAAALLVAVSSCTKEEINDLQGMRIKGVERHIVGTASLPATDKAYIDFNDGNKVVWSANDYVNINGVSIQGSDIDGSHATFEGTTYAIPSNNQEIYWAVYPESYALPYDNAIPSSFTATTLTLDMPSIQTCDINDNPLEGVNCMAAYASVPQGTTQVNFEMKNLCSVIHLTLQAAAGTANTYANRIVLQSSSKLSGAFTTDNTMSLTATNGAYDNMVVYLSDGNNDYIDISSEKEVYLIIPPVSGDFTIRIYNTDNKYITKTASNFSTNRNTVYSNTINNVTFSESSKISVSAVNSVVFSPGNLQYNPSEGTWQFAAEQFDFIGADNANISSSYNDWVDLFGWGTSGYDNTNNDPYAINFQPYATGNSEVDATNNFYGYGPSINMTDPSLVGTSSPYDWGIFNIIYNPKTETNDPAGTWRTPSAAEWLYMFNTRSAATVNGTSNARFAKGKVSGVPGVIIFPDDFINVGRPIHHINEAASTAYQSNEYTSDDWPVMEAQGCIFLPNAGYRTPSGVSTAAGSGNYWSSTYDSSKKAKCIQVADLSSSVAGFRYYGRSVRLVKNAQ